MLNLWIFSAFFTMLFTIVLTDDFIAINYPDGVILEPSETPLPLKQIKYVLRAIVGEDASSNGQFSPLKINNIFAIPKRGFIMTLHLDKSADYSALGTLVKYSIKGRRPSETFRHVINFEKFYVTKTLTKNSTNIDYINLENKLHGVKFTEAEPVMDEVQTLLASDAVEKITVDIRTKNFVGIHLFNKKDALDFGKLIDPINKFKDILNNTSIFFGIVTYGGDTETLSSQNASYALTIDPIEFRRHNVAPLYDENYAAIFNIIFWFTVCFAFTLFAVILALHNMDPGRDTIIYRMTATRSKKGV
ncbi:ATPase H(+)-transporting accessory protein 2-like [Anastrepha obliqua]|uniref:ATPase H(+)-transporting accessory protein 2-like n=1 Tax=Anastrepha obliqua TaxID=95512 RepID=UPI00240A65B9|nr:ATPase H(+)-transporting accessory protein 2-like [Anastrepha obliqua]